MLFQIYISYIRITVEKRLKQGGHISLIPLWPLLSVFYIYIISDVDKKHTSAEKAYDICFLKSNVFENGCVYICIDVKQINSVFDLSFNYYLVSYYNTTSVLPSSDKMIKLSDECNTQVVSVV